MCSIHPDVQLAGVCRAIEELAGRPDSGDEALTVGASAQDGRIADEDVSVRLAAIWAMVAAADPELARRLPGYLNAGRHSRVNPASGE